MEISTNTAHFTPTFYECEYCCITCNKISDWKRHLTTKKHFVNKNGGISTMETNTFICECGNIYKERTGLWKHKKKCQYNKKNEDLNENQNENLNENIPNKNDQSNKDNLIEYLIKENSEFKTLIMELIKKDSISNNINSTINSHNKTFNLQFFLNEQCKDAMNIMDFVNSMTLEFADLEAVGKLGYVEGISGIIIKKLNEMDVYKRPIHCSDAKREIMYVKDDNVWEKENSTYDKLRKAIKYVTKKNGDMLIPWSKMYPACMNTSHPLNDTYIQIMGQAMGGKEEFVDSENKIMKKIAKAVLIDKNV
jgi:hypothetical protein